MTKNRPSAEEMIHAFKSLIVSCDVLIVAVAKLAQSEPLLDAGWSDLQLMLQIRELALRHLEYTENYGVPHA